MASEDYTPFLQVDDDYFADDWPVMPDGTDYDGKGLLALARSGNSPFRDAWDFDSLTREVESGVGVEIIDVPLVSKGSNNLVRFISPSTSRSSHTDYCSRVCIVSSRTVEISWFA